MNQHVNLPAPYLHDRWEDQVELEKSMLSMGRERVQARITKAEEKRDMNRLRPYRSLLKEWVMPTSEAISTWIAKAKRKPGVRPVALPRMEELSPDTAAMVALKTILRHLGVRRPQILGLALEIGTWCEHEARCQKWMEEEPEDWRITAATYAKQGSNAAHQRRSRIALFNKFVWEKIGWIAWTEQDRIRVGLELLNIVIEESNRFHIIPDPDWVPKRLRGGIFAKRPFILAADEELLQWLRAAMDDELVHAPVFLPTLIPPKPWTGPRDGGYWTPFVKTPFLIRFKAHHEETRNIALEEYEALDMPDVYRAVNIVQETPWAINKRVLAVADTIWDNDLAIAGLPSQDIERVPERPEGAEKGSEEYREWAKKAGAARSRNATIFSRVIAYRRAIVTARRFRDEPEFYFPHMLDFRGRLYPIPADLSPQGEDLHRGLLTFARPKALTQEGARWLAVHLANTFGIDKVAFEDRIAWTKEREAQWRSINEDPLADRRWIGRDDDDNWQRLAAVFEWVRWLDEGEGMMSSLPVRIDGTCNGIQHLSAMIRDEVGGASVNLVPSEKPRDIYQEVADILTPMLEERLPEPKAAMWLQLFGGRAGRDVTKRPVMILPYGGTQNAYYTYTMKWLNERDPEGVYVPLYSKERTDLVAFLVPIMWEAVGKNVEKAREVQEWLQECAKRTTAQGKALWWRTPVGFYVRQFYATSSPYRIKTHLDGQRIDLQAHAETKELHKDDQIRAIAPNFVHSMDASALMSFVLLAEANGIESITTIHDAYGTVAEDMQTLYACTRQAFVDTHSVPVLEQFREACREIAGQHIVMPEPLPIGGLDIEQVLESAYFFA